MLPFWLALLLADRSISSLLLSPLPSFSGAVAVAALVVDGNVAALDVGDAADAATVVEANAVSVAVVALRLAVRLTLVVLVSLVCISIPSPVVVLLLLFV